MSSLVKKYLMAITGLILTAFVFVHMLGNLQVFMPPEAINAYAYFLHHTLPWEALWGFRIAMVLAVVIHVWTAIQLKMENAAARPERYHVNSTVVASSASRYMAMSGIVLLAFIIFHILHFTTRNAFPEFNHFYTLNADGEKIFDAYAMMVYGFSNTFWYVSVFYIISMILLAWHLSHGVSSLFQSLGFRNESWRYRLDKLALLYGIVVAAGFISIPAGVLISQNSCVKLVQIDTVTEALAGWDGSSDILITYPDCAPCDTACDTEKADATSACAVKKNCADPQCKDPQACDMPCQNKAQSCPATGKACPGGDACPGPKACKGAQSGSCSPQADCACADASPTSAQ